MPERSAAGTRFDVVGIGNALVDVIAHADDSFLADHGLVKGSMQLDRHGAGRWTCTGRSVRRSR